MVKPIVSVIIISWNRREDTRKTLEDLKKQKIRDCEIIVIDQGSTDGTPDVIESEYPYARVIRLNSNIGVPGGRNIGAINSRGDILVFIDNDASLEEDSLENVVKLFSSSNSIGIIGFKILNATTNKYDMNSWVYQKSKFVEANASFDTYTYCGAGHAIRKEVFEKVGYYWNDLFFSWEEMDLSIRVLDAGYKIVYNPNIIVYHRISDENRTPSIKHECLRLRNSLWVAWRYLPRYYAIWEGTVRIIAYLVKSIKGRYFLRMLFTIFGSFRRFNLIFSSRYRISRAGFVEYKKLSDKGPILEQIRGLIR